jgi:hypothetical protein
VAAVVVWAVVVQLVLVVLVVAVVPTVLAQAAELHAKEVVVLVKAGTKREVGVVLETHILEATTGMVAMDKSHL